MRGIFWKLGLLPLAASLLHGAADAPDWVKQLASAPVPGYPAKVNSVVLFQEEAVTVDADGRRVMRERGAIKILQRSEEKIEAYRTYNAKNGRIRDFQGWLIPPSGKAVPYGKNSILDRAISLDDVYNEVRAKVLECGSVVPDSIFAWEVTEEEKSVFTQVAYGFQERSPVLLSRFALTLPAGWEAKGVLFNSGKQEPSVSGNTYT